MSSKEKYNWAILEDFSAWRCDNDETRHIPTKNSKTNPLLIKSFLEPNWNVPLKKQWEKTSIWNLTHRWKKNPVNHAAIVTNTRKKNRGVSSFLHLGQSNIWAPGTTIPLKHIIEKLHVVRKKRNPATLSNFSPCGYDIGKMRNNSQKTLKSIQSWSNPFWNPIANVSVKVKYEKPSTQNLTHMWQKVIASNDAAVFTNTMKKRELCPISLYMSEQRLSTRYKTCMHHQSFKFFSNLCSSKTKF